MPEALKLTVALDESQLAAMRAALDPKNVPKATAAAINKTLAKLKTETSKTVRQTIYAKAEDVRERMRVVKASASNLSGRISILRKAVPLAKYSPKQRRDGVSVKIYKGKRREVITHAFIARMPGGHIGVFKRKPNWKHKLVDVQGGRKIYHGLPIKEIYGPTIAGVIAGNPKILPRLEAFAAEDLVKQLASQTQRFSAMEDAAAERAEEAESSDSE